MAAKHSNGGAPNGVVKQALANALTNGVPNFGLTLQVPPADPSMKVTVGVCVMEKKVNLQNHAPQHCFPSASAAHDSNPSGSLERQCGVCLERNFVQVCQEVNFAHFPTGPGNGLHYTVAHCRASESERKSVRARENLGPPIRDFILCHRFADKFSGLAIHFLLPLGTFMAPSIVNGSLNCQWVSPSSMGLCGGRGRGQFSSRNRPRTVMAETLSVVPSPVRDLVVSPQFGRRKWV